MKCLKFVFGNPYNIWKKKKDDFLQISQDEIENWTDHFSPEREQWKVSGFLATVECLVTKFDTLQEDEFSSNTFQSRIPATMEILSGPLNTSRQTFKNIQEVLKKEAKLEAVTSLYILRYSG